MAANLPLLDIIDALKFAERTAAMYAAGADKRGHTVAATRHKADAARYAKALEALLARETAAAFGKAPPARPPEVNGRRS